VRNIFKHVAEIPLNNSVNPEGELVIGSVLGSPNTGLLIDAKLRRGLFENTRVFADGVITEDVFSIRNIEIFVIKPSI
jgi:hypothetical protein